MPAVKEIKRRIKSVNNIKKITKAMEMVAAAKMRRAVETVTKTRPYAELCWQTLLNVATNIPAQTRPLHPLLERHNLVKKIAVVLITSNRGLCGGFNSVLLNKVKSFLSQLDQKVEVDFILWGRKGATVQRWGYNIAAVFTKEDLINETKEVGPVAAFLIENFQAKNYNQIILAYTDFINPLKQVPRLKQLLPLDIEADKYLGQVTMSLAAESTNNDIIQPTSKRGGKAIYLFEPSPETVLEEVLPRLIEIQLFQALLESSASEHSARMGAMRQATEAAEGLVDELNLSYNKARQAAITQEIAEISAGANALAQ
ncbi:ATP synthase F1 subunit gamma [Candidatus Parcubacteria bacterium]|nr:MAG: ATP synthase F1 subunit gamma [Candidatus Parcubacteria bacterium]